MSSPWEDLLPKCAQINGLDYEIRSDYRAILDICTALSDPELSMDDKVEAALVIFYPGILEMPPEDYQEAVQYCFWFLNGGEAEPNRPAPKLMDWQQDFRYIVAPINRVMGTEIRSLEYLHWWTFLAAYYEMGDCLFAQMVRIREKQARGKPLDKTDAEWYRRNRELVDLKTTYTHNEEELLRQWVK